MDFIQNITHVKKHQKVDDLNKSFIRTSVIVILNIINKNCSCFQATGRVWAKIPDSDHVTVERAVKAAKDAFATW